MRRPMFSQHVAVLGLAVLTASGLAATASAQHTPDPYNIVGEYNIGYENYMYPNYPNGYGFSPNQGVLQGRSGNFQANQFQNYIQGLDGAGDGSDSLFAPSGQGRGGVVPYYRAHRQYAEALEQVYSPNQKADQAYYKDRDERTRKYLEYLRESDPKKRAQLYREYQQQSLRASRDLGAGASRAASRSGATAPSTATNPARRSTARGAGAGAASGRQYGLPAPSDRARGAATSPSLLETPDQILDRAERMDRSPRPAAPSRVPNRRAPASNLTPR